MPLRAVLGVYSYPLHTIQTYGPYRSVYLPSRPRSNYPSAPAFARLADDVPANRILHVDLLRSKRRCPAMFRLEACPRPTSYHLDSADLPRLGSNSDRRPAAGRRPIVLATNLNGGKLRLNASRAGKKEGHSLPLCFPSLFFPFPPFL